MTIIPISNDKNAIPAGIVYAASLKGIFVANSHDKDVSVISAMTFKILGTIVTGGAPQSVAFDPKTLNVYITSFECSDVTVASTKSLKDLATIHVGIYPSGIAYSPANSRICVSSHDRGIVKEIQSLNVVKNFTISAAPWGITFDTANMLMYVVGATDPGTVTILG